MELILLQNIKKLGLAGEKVKVKNGFGRNFLLPQGKAVRATDENREHFESMKLDIAKHNDEKLKSALEVVEKLEGKIISIVRQAGEDGKLYGSVSARDIALSLKEDSIQRENILLDESIKYLGEYKIKVLLHSQAEVEISVHVVRNEKAE